MLSKRVRERMVSLYKLEMFVHNHLMAGPSTSHALHVMLFCTHAIRRVLTFTGWRNRYGPASIPWRSLPPSKGRRGSPVTLAIRVQSSRVNGLAWAAPQASGAPVPASSPSFPSTSAVIKASLSVGAPGLSARGASVPPAEPGDRGGPKRHLVMGRQGDDGHVSVMPALRLEGHQL
jgi:hypothetical protein